MASSTKMIMFWVAVVLMLGIGVRGLSTHHYSSSCPEVFSTTKAVVEAAVKKEARMGASLLRLHFHDCFVNGCDGSILLDDEYLPPNTLGEKTALGNINSVRGFDVVDDIKAAVEKVCPGIVSCADILAIAARDSTVLLGGPSWKVRLGRKDSTTANHSATIDLPAFFANLSTLISGFKKKGLSVKDLVALSGAHTIGLASCSSFIERIYNDTNIDSIFAAKLQRKCPRVGSSNSLSRLDTATPKHFDNRYFRNLLRKKGLLHSDQALTSSIHTLSRVKKYVKKPSRFFKNFAKSMVKMGKISPLTGSEGEIRINCRKAN